ncbi:MAG: transposase [Sulfuricurvum sp.]|jgi:transposase|uniref:IS110 family transposase n=1 Tax=Sulfuricurvum sp. TaxID=2025608 RepID=UPI0025EE4F3D|nr:transposase [Sulfuricurvum sp.]MCK9373471.1 transposase [Sulfuricurvum sp.]
MKAKIESLDKSFNFTGIDISKDTFDVCFLIENKPHYNKYDQTLNGYESFLSVYKMLNGGQIGFESTGVYHKDLEKFLVAEGLEPFVLSPRSVFHFSKSSKKTKGKTDKSDSYSIALYLSKNEDNERYEKPTLDRFKPYTTSLELYEKQIRQTKNLLHSLKVRKADDFLILELEQMILKLSDMQDILEKYAVKELYTAIPEAKLIKDEIKGVGDGLLLNLLPIIYDTFDKFKPNQTVSFIGLSPVPYESGISVKRGSHISHSGDKNARKALYMSAVSSVMWNPIIKLKYQRLLETGKPKKKALVTIMTHILRLIISRLSQHTGRHYKNEKTNTNR